MASGAVKLGEAVMALDSSLRKTITIEEEFVRKSRKESAGLFLPRWVEIACRKAVNVCRHAAGNEFSVGRIGEYHHLDAN